MPLDEVNIKELNYLDYLHKTTIFLLEKNYAEIVLL